MKTRRMILIGLSLAAAFACSGDSGGPKSGTATVSLITPNTDDGAISVVLTGPGLSNVQPASSAYAAYWRVVSANEVHIIVAGDLSASVLATVTVDDLQHVGDYHAQVLEVASRSDVPRISVAGYAVTLRAQ